MAADDPTPGLSRRALLQSAAMAGAVTALEAVTSSSSAEAASARLARRHRRPHRPRGAPPAPAPKHPRSAPPTPEDGPRGILPDPGPIAARHSDPADLGVLEAASLLQARVLSAQELLSACQRRIGVRNGPVSFAGAPSDINAWIRLYPQAAAQQAAAADATLARAGVRTHGGSPSYLAGIPLALKDLYAVRGLPVTASSQVLAGNVAAGDSTVWSKLASAGMVLVGHAHTDEFAFYYTTPQVGNPWDTSRVAGGSSGGSAAALAARMVPAATGSDTLGSLRIPASFCGVSSIKPTFGLVSTYGVIPYVYSLDHAGVMARSSADVALLLSYVAGPSLDDPSTSTAAPGLYPTAARSGATPLAGTRIGVADGLVVEAGIAAVLDRFHAELQPCSTTGRTSRRCPRATGRSRFSSCS